MMPSLSFSVWFRPLLGSDRFPIWFRFLLGLWAVSRSHTTVDAWAGNAPASRPTTPFFTEQTGIQTRRRAAMPALPSNELIESADPPRTVAVVLGGSGFAGRRVCRALVNLSSETGGSKVSRVVSVSRSGKPPPCYLGEDDPDWSDRVEWIQHDLARGENLGTEEKDAPDRDPKTSDLAEALASVLRECATSSNDDDDAANAVELAIVGCIGNSNPSPTWIELWGLGFDQEQLFRDNGEVYQTFVREAILPLVKERNNVRVRRCVLLSLDYNSQKCLEGPLEGYVEGKRLAERTFLGCVSASADETEGLDDVIVLGLPFLVHGGRRFPGFGKLYRKLVESPLARAYVGFNRALRSLSKTNSEDWVEEMFFSSPTGVDDVGELAAMAANGLVTRDMVNDGQPRKQGFFDTSGLPIEYDDVLFVDGTENIELVIDRVRREQSLPTSQRRRMQTTPSSSSSSSSSPPLWEGALTGKQPYLYPIPVALFFATFFWGVATEQFVREPL